MKGINIEDEFLNEMGKENRYVTVFLVKGFELGGEVKGFGKKMEV